jgi:hypothetical protein
MMRLLPHQASVGASSSAPVINAAIILSHSLQKHLLEVGQKLRAETGMIE